MIGTLAWSKETVGRHRSSVLAYALLVCLFVATTAVSPGFASLSDLGTVATQASFMAIVAIGQTFVIIGGGIDLSVPAVISGSAVLVSSLAHGNDSTLTWVVPLLLGLGCLVGIVNGIGVAMVGVSPIIMTLGTEGVAEGALQVYTRGTGFGSAPKAMVWLSTHRWGPLPVEVLLWLALGLVAGYVLRRTAYGRRLYAIGSSATVSRFSGVNVASVTLASYVVSSICGVIAGLVISGYVGTTYLTLGDTYLFTSIAAVAIGGASILGGSGTYAGTVAGALTLTVLVTLLNILNLSQGMLDIIYGAIILLTVGIGTMRWHRTAD